MKKLNAGRFENILGGGASFLLPLLLLGLLLRFWLGGILGPMSGDPVFSYSYRALLMAHGEWAGLFKMWHPPGYPVILAFLHRLSGYAISPYQIGRALNLVCYVALTLIVDGLLRSRATKTTRLVTAACLAFWETLFYWEAVAVTEPLYAVLLYGTIALFLRWNGKSLGPILLGAVLMGIAGTMRREAIAPLVGMGLWLMVETSRARRPTRTTFLVLGTLLLGYLATAGWTFLDPLYRVHMKAQEFSFTVPVAQGLTANVLRAVECVYRALVEWLPQVLLLPFWMLAACGLLSKVGEKSWDRLHALVLLSLLPALAAVVLTIQHKRTGFFLIPAAALYFGLGFEWLASQLGKRQPKWIPVALVLVLVMVGGQSLRILWRLKKFPPDRNREITYRQSLLLRKANIRPAKIWAFGNEPEIYAYWGQPLDYPFDQRSEYAHTYSDHAKEPARFLEALRQKEIRYLLFSLPASPSDTAPQDPYGILVPARSDLENLVRQAPSLHLKALGEETMPEGGPRLYLFELGDAPSAQSASRHPASSRIVKKSTKCK